MLKSNFKGVNGMDLKTIASTNELFIVQFHEGFVRVRCSSDNTRGFFDRKGKFNSPPTTAAILGKFQEGMAGVCLPVSGVWGFVYNEDPGKWAIPPTNFTYADAGFREEMCLVKQNGIWCFIDIHGKVVFMLNL
jgi:WG containing repeat